MEWSPLKSPHHVVLVTLQSSLVVEKAAGQQTEVLNEPNQVLPVEETVVLRVGRLIGENEERFDPLFELVSHGENPLMLGPPMVTI